MSTTLAPDIENPAVWDGLLNTCDTPDQLMGELADLATPVRARRYLAAAVATCNRHTITNALAAVEARHDISGAGVRLMALGQLGKPEAIQAAPLAVPGALTPLELEDACDRAMARGMSARGLQLFEEAHAQLSVALFLARTLGMRHREQHTMLELAQVMTIQGRPDPELIEEALAMPIPITRRRRRYGSRALAEAYMAVGDYRRARDLVATSEGAQCDLWAFTCALLGDQSARDAEVTAGLYTLLAEAVWALREGREVDLPPMPPHSPEAEYAELLRGVAMLTSRPTVKQARRRFERLSPITPDQRVWQLAGLVHAAGLLGAEPEAGRFMQAFAQALDALRTREFILPLLRAVMPEAYLLLALLPFAHPAVEDTVVDLPVLSGEGVRYRYGHHKLPGRAAGAALLVRFAASGERVSIHRQAHERIRDALSRLGLGRVLNLGVALRALVLLREAAPGGEREAWQRALEHALTWIDTEVICQDILRDLAECKAP